MSRPRWACTSPAGRDDLGSVGTAIGDYDNDGDLDLFVASYGPDVLWQNQGDGTFVNAAPGTPLAGDHHSVAADWGDIDNDGWLDLYVDTFLSSEAEARDYLFRGGASGFEDVHCRRRCWSAARATGSAFADFDLDGDVDLSLTNNHAEGSHPLYRNDLPPGRAARSLQVAVVDHGRPLGPRGRDRDRAARIGRVHISPHHRHRGRLLPPRVWGPRISGCRQGAGPVSITIAWFEAGARRTTTVSGVAPEAFRITVAHAAAGCGQSLTLRATTASRRRNAFEGCERGWRLPPASCSCRHDHQVEVVVPVVVGRLHVLRMVLAANSPSGSSGSAASRYET